MRAAAEEQGKSAWLEPKDATKSLGPPSPVLRMPAWWRDAVGCATWASMLVVVAMWVSGGGLAALTGLGSGLTSLGRLTGLVASDLLLVQVLLMARVPVVERVYGQDALARRHRLVGFTSFNLMVGHVVLITLGYALDASVNPLVVLWQVVAEQPGMLLAFAGALLLVMVTVTSIRKARRKLRYESWHLLHLYAYLGVGLALPHQLWTGQEFLSSPLATGYWWTLWVAAAAAVLVWRLGLPLYRTLTYQLRVVQVIRERSDVVSVVMRGRHLHRLPVAAGQFFTWRFLDGPGSTRGHPYSLSAAPHGDTLRITVKDLGDASGDLARVRPGTRVAIEGPYGRLHEGVRTRRKVLLMASGIGVTPLRALLESLPQDPGDVTLVYRAHTAQDLIFKNEIEALGVARGARVFYVIGPRIPGRDSWLPQSAAGLSDEDALRQIAPDVAQHDLYLCGAVGCSAGRAVQRCHRSRQGKLHRHGRVHALPVRAQPPTGSGRGLQSPQRLVTRGASMHHTMPAARHEEFRKRATQALAGGVSSNTRLLNPHLIVERASGARLWDVDGVDYIDYVLGQGPNFLGYSPPGVLEKVLDAQRGGVIFAATHRGEVEAAELFLDTLGWPELMRFGTSSTEMVQAGLRMARHATGRRRIIRFHGHYHGWMDNIQIASSGVDVIPASGGQSTKDIEDLITLEWNDAEALTRAADEQGSDVAAMIMEPMMLNGGSIEPRPGYLAQAKDLCAANGIVLIFDETITGFRLALGGACERFGVTPDLAVYGKAMAAGWPCAAIAGRASLFDAVASGTVTVLGTFNGNVVATAAAHGALEELRRPGVYERVEAAGIRLIEGLADVFRERGLPVVLQGPPMAFHARFEESGLVAQTYAELLRSDPQAYARLADALIASGVWVTRRGIWYVSTAHTGRDVEETLERVAAALSGTSAHD